ncbi:MAG: sensor histidine kinase [Pseudomonadota bacterium]
MTRPRKRLGGIADRLGFRLALSVALALVPVAVLVFVQSLAARTEMRARSEAALAGETLRAAAAQILTIRKAEGASEALALVIGQILPDKERCDAIMAATVGRGGTYLFAGYYAQDRSLICASTPPGPGGGALASDVPASPGVDLAPGDVGADLWILRASSPVYGPRGERRGFVILAVPHRPLGNRAEAGSPGPLGLITFDRSGAILTSSAGPAEAARQLPANANLDELARRGPLTFSGYDRAGQWRSFAVTPVVEGRLYAMGTWAVAPMGLLRLTAGLPPLLLGLLVAGAGLIASWIVAERLVVRHIRQLRNAMRSFATGGRVVGDLAFDGAPLELRDVAESYAQMTDTILHDEAELEDMLHQKEVLLREVHHRVKNNLQLIASIMNMQIRQARNPEVRQVMRTLQDRVMSLATIHRGLYQTTGLTDIRADELLSEIVRQIIADGRRPSRQFRLDTRFDDIRLTPDQAVPLALLLTEALTNAVAHASSPDGLPALSVALERSGPFRARLTASNSAVTPLRGGAAAPPEPGRGLGRSLVSAFAQQLDTVPEITEGDGLYTLSVTFDLIPLADAEERAAALRQASA